MKAKFIARVMQIMNELGWDDTGSNAFIGSDKTKVQGHIESVFVDAWRKSVDLFPKTYFSIKDFSNYVLTPDIDSGIGYIILPDDFYMIYSFRMRGWKKSVNTLYEITDHIASIQSNEYTRGNIVRPVCVIDSKIIGSRSIDGHNMEYNVKNIIRYYSLDKGAHHKIEEAYYIPLMGSLSDITEINEKLFIPLAYIAASMVFNIYEKTEIAKFLVETAIEISK